MGFDFAAVVWPQYFATLIMHTIKIKIKICYHVSLCLASWLVRQDHRDSYISTVTLNLGLHDKMMLSIE
jgi:hypothetical protein